MNDRNTSLSEYQRGRRDAYEQGLHEILARLDRMEHVALTQVRALLDVIREERRMRQSTQDLIDAVKGLQDTATQVGTAIDALVAAQASDDDDAVEQQVNILKGLGPQLQSHLPQVASAATTAVQAPEDTGATVPAPAASGS